LFADFHSCGTFHSLFQARFVGLSLGTKVGDGVRAVTNAQRAVQMFVNGDATSRQCDAKPSGGNLKNAIGKLDRIVSSHDSFMLDGEDTIQIEMKDGYKGGAGLSSGDGELSIELADVMASQKMIRLLHRANVADA